MTYMDFARIQARMMFNSDPDILAKHLAIMDQYEQDCGPFQHIDIPGAGRWAYVQAVYAFAQYCDTHEQSESVFASMAANAKPGQTA